MPITINGSGTITGASTLATTVVSPTLTTATLTTPTLTTPNINSASFATVLGTAPIYPCRAWVNFNGSGTVAIRASGNVSSITDNGTGDYTVNFTTAITDTNYGITCSAQAPTGAGVAIASHSSNGLGDEVPPTTTTCRINTNFGTTSGNRTDSPSVAVAIFR